MKTSQRLGVLATVLALSGLMTAAHAYENTAPREQRMDEALNNYRGAAAKNPQPGPAARAEESAKRGAKRTGEVIKYGAQRTGEAATTGARKAGDAIRRGGEALKDKTGG